MRCGEHVRCLRFNDKGRARDQCKFAFNLFFYLMSVSVAAGKQPMVSGSAQSNIRDSIFTLNRRRRLLVRPSRFL